MENERLIFKIAIKVNKKALAKEDINEIGRFFASDIENIYDNNEDFIETEFLGWEIDENS